jgi:hypothetical protein
MKFEVEVEVLYIYGIEADDEHEAQIIAQMNVSDHAPYLELTIASIYAEKMESENIPTEWVQRPPPGYFQQPKSNHL